MNILLYIFCCRVVNPQIEIQIKVLLTRKRNRFYVVKLTNNETKFICRIHERDFNIQKKRYKIEKKSIEVVFIK